MCVCTCVLAHTHTRTDTPTTLVGTCSLNEKGPQSGWDKQVRKFNLTLPTPVIIGRVWKGQVCQDSRILGVWVAKPIWGPVCSVLTFAPDSSACTDFPLFCARCPGVSWWGYGVSVITPDSTLGSGQGSFSWTCSIASGGQRKCVPCVCGGEQSLPRGPGEASVKQAHITKRGMSGTRFSHLWRSRYKPVGEGGVFLLYRWKIKWLVNVIKVFSKTRPQSLG